MKIRERARQRNDAIARGQGLRNIRRIEGPVGASTHIHGFGELRMFASNDYLGLANHPLVVAAAKAGLERYGAGTGGARFICGTTMAHVEFECELATFLGFEAAVTLPSGFAANIALISTLAEPGDLILSDALNHASLIDGCKMAPAGVRTVVYQHADTDAVRRALASAPTTGQTFILTDGVFSMEGDLAPLHQLSQLAEDHDATLVVDDAHGLGVLGATGAGTAQHLGVCGGVHILTGSLGKAIGGAAGGFVAGPREVIDLLTQVARPQLFSTALPVASICAAREALRQIAQNPTMVSEISHKARLFREALRIRNLPVLRGLTPIVPVMLGSSARARAIAEELMRDGVYAAPIAFPVVPEGESRIRFQVSRGHSDFDLEETANIVADCFARII